MKPYELWVSLRIEIWDPFHWHALTWIRQCLGCLSHSFTWNVITHPFKFNRLRSWKNNYVLLLCVDVNGICAFIPMLFSSWPFVTHAFRWLCCYCSHVYLSLTNIKRNSTELWYLTGNYAQHNEKTEYSEVTWLLLSSYHQQKWHLLCAIWISVTTFGVNSNDLGRLRFAKWFGMETYFMLSEKNTHGKVKWIRHDLGVNTLFSMRASGMSISMA